MIPNSLKIGDKIGVIAPSNVIKKDDMEYIKKSKELLEDSGFEVVFGQNIAMASTKYGATAKQKAKDVNDMFKDSRVKAIFCVKGGNDSNSTFEYLDYEVIKNNPKIICGFSDSTSILNIIHEITGLVTFNGPTFKSLTSWQTDYGYKQIMERFVLKNLKLGQDDDKFITLKDGVAQGKLIGGNLSLFSQMITGKYNVNVDNKILFLEDLGIETEPNAINHYFYYLKQNGVFDKIKGIWLGNYEHESKITIEEILLNCLENEYNFPIIKSDNFGHIDKKTVIPIGIEAKIDTSKDIKIELLENCVK